MERERELRHFIHEHPLIFNERLKESQRRFICDGCLKQMSDPNYSCKECYWIILHKSCAELPRELGHPLHPKHPLLLIHQYSLGRIIKCDGCNTEKVQGRLIYHCSHCDFSLDIKCASLPLTIQAEIHQAHPLTLVRRSLCFTCDACGKEGKKGMFYLCAICPFFVHPECTSYPLVVKNMRHRRHPLHLTNSLQPQLNQSDHRLCLLCVQKISIFQLIPIAFLVKSHISSLGELDIREHPLTSVDKREALHPPCDKCGDSCHGRTFEYVKCNFRLHRYCLFQMSTKCYI